MKLLKKSLLLLLCLVTVCSVVFAQGANEAKAKEIPVIKWVTVGNGMPNNYKAWQENINAYLEKKIGAHVDVECISWGDFDQKQNVLVTTNGDYDIMFNNSNVFTNYVGLGAFADITEEVKQYAPTLYKYIPEAYWSATSVNGKIYAVPTYKDSSMTNYIIWDKAMALKYGVDLAENDLNKLTPYLQKIADGEHINPVIAPLDFMDVSGNFYDDCGASLPCIGVRIDDKSRTVVNPFNQDDVQGYLAIFNSWFKSGIMNADAATLAEAPKYRVFNFGQGWSGAAKTAWGPQMGVEVHATQVFPTVLTNNTVRGSLNSVNANSPYLKEALQLLELVNTDSYVRDAFFYGLEGDNFAYTADKKVHKNNNDWKFAGYTQGTFFTVSQTDDVDFNQWDEVKALNEKATASVMLGFTMDRAPVENEIANCNTVFQKYKQLLKNGAGDPKETAAKMQKELDAAGYQKVVAELQKQINAAY